MSTEQTLFNPDDPRLTAYALGELTDPTERAQVEQFLAASPGARAALADIRTLTAALTAEYEQERVAAETTPANVIALPLARRLSLGPWLKVAALLLVVGLAVGIALPAYHSEQLRARKPRMAAALLEKAQKVQAAATPAASAPLLAANKEQQPTMDEPDVRELVVPQGQPLPTNLPPGTTAVYGPSAASGVAGGNPHEAGLASSDASLASSVRTAARARVASTTPPPVAAKKGAISFALPQTDTVGQLRAPTDMAMAAPPAAPAQAAALQQAPPTLPNDNTGVIHAYDKLEAGPNTAEYSHLVENRFLAAKENPLSTFSLDVDTASYAIVRRFIDAGSLPPKDAVRIEEMLNYFPYDDAPPAPDSQKPFAIHLEAAACPWNTGHRLVRIGIKAREMDRDRRPPSNLVFLLDVSGSMMPPERLPLIKKCLRLLVEKLREDDHVAIVVYAGESGLALPSSTGDHQEAILRAIDNLRAGGSTNGAAGIRLAYQVARQHFIQGGTNRVILSTDGDFNVGVTSRGDLLRLVEEERRDGVFLTVLGVGTDNLKDATMQVLADHGNGNYAYLDRLEEGRKVLVDQLSGTLVTVAKDVKVQVEFNPAAVASYRLIGYEKRLLHKEDFNDDRVDAGEIGAGHSVTALYEVVPVGGPSPETGPAVDALKYQPAPTGGAAKGAPEAATHEMLTVKMRLKAPDSDRSERTEEQALVDRGALGKSANASPDFQFSAAVASFGMILRDSPYKGDATLGSALALAQAGKGEDPHEYRAGFIELLRQTQALQQRDR